MRHRWTSVLLLAAACHRGAPMSDPDAAFHPESHALGMNDVSILVPLPADPTTTTTLLRIGDGTEPLISREQYREAGVYGEYGDYHVVAIRFDLCDRVTPGPCPTSADGQLRLVIQPLTVVPNVPLLDAAAQASYPIPAADLAAVIKELRALARIADRPATDRIGVSPAIMAANPEYIVRLRALVRTYARASQLTRLAEFHFVRINLRAHEWMMSAIERNGGTTFDGVVIPGSDASLQSPNFYAVEQSVGTNPIIDTPTGLNEALSACMQTLPSPINLPAAMTVLSSIENPTLHTAKSVACVGCHVSSPLIDCATKAGAGNVPERFTSIFDTTVEPRPGLATFRAFGYVDRSPIIVQRTANETANVLTEIEARFPAPH